MKHHVDTEDELRELVEPLRDAGTFVIGIYVCKGGRGWDVEWQDHKHYVAQDGESYPDEVWTTKEGKIILVQDLDPEHCRNVLRMLLRQRRKYEEMLDDNLSDMSDTSDDELLDIATAMSRMVADELDGEPQPVDKKPTLH